MLLLVARILFELVEEMDSDIGVFPGVEHSGKAFGVNITTLKGSFVRVTALESTGMELTRDELGPDKKTVNKMTAAKDKPLQARFREAHILESFSPKPIWISWSETIRPIEHIAKVIRD